MIANPECGLVVNNKVVYKHNNSNIQFFTNQAPFVDKLFFSSTKWHLVKSINFFKKDKQAKPNIQDLENKTNLLENYFENYCYQTSYLTDPFISLIKRPSIATNSLLTKSFSFTKPTTKPLKLNYNLIHAVEQPQHFNLSNTSFSLDTGLLLSKKATVKLVELYQDQNGGQTLNKPQYFKEIKYPYKVLNYLQSPHVVLTSGITDVIKPSLYNIKLDCDILTSHNMSQPLLL